MADWPQPLPSPPGNWPFNGPVGDGHDGALIISSNVTATEMVYQCTDVTISSTWTLKQQNPGGLFMACTGTFRMVSGGIIDANSLGGLGGAGRTGGTSVSGGSGRGFGGSGGSGGGSTSSSGASGDVYWEDKPLTNQTGPPEAEIGGNNSATVPPSSNSTATLAGYLLNHHISLVNPGKAGVSSGGGNSGNAPDSTYVTPYFDYLVSHGQLMKIMGYGSGASGGARDTNLCTAGTNGGGFVLVVCNNLDFRSGAIIRASSADSSNSATGCAGGTGGGGVIVILYRNLITNAGTLTVSAGTPGTNGGGSGSGGTGGAGYSKVALLRY